MVGGRGHARQCIGRGFAIDDDDARVAAAGDLRQVALHDGKAVAVVGQGLENHPHVLVGRVDHKDGAAAHAMQGLADDAPLFGGEGSHVVHVASNEGWRTAVGEPRGVHLLVHVAQACRAVDHQRSSQFGAFQNVGGVDELDVEGRVFAHQDDVKIT